MAAKTVRVVVEITPRAVSVALSNDIGVQIESETFTLSRREGDLTPASVGRDVFNLLYQCAADAVHGEATG